MDVDSLEQSWRAELRLGFRHDARTRRTILADRMHRGPLVVQKSLHPEGETCHVVIVHPPGGIAGGDRLRIAVTVDPDAQALLTTPGATRWYKSNGRAASQSVQIDVAAGARCEWLPQETIVFDAAAADNDVCVTLRADSVFIGWDIVCFGRLASGESMRTGHYRQRLRIEREKRLIWNDQGVFRPSAADARSIAAFDGAAVTATLLAVAPVIPSAILDAARECAAASGERIAVSRLPGGLLVARILGDSTEAAWTLMRSLWSTLRPALLGKAATSPRIWNV